MNLKEIVNYYIQGRNLTSAEGLAEVLNRGKKKEELREKPDARKVIEETGVGLYDPHGKRVEPNKPIKFEDCPP